MLNRNDRAMCFRCLPPKIHLWELTDEINDKGFYVTRHHTMATLRFHDVSGLQLTGFNHQNAIFGLAITREERPDGPSPVFSVKFEEAFGVKAEFICMRIEVVEVVECDEEGHADVK
jgi:hypothetical protein